MAACSRSVWDAVLLFSISICITRQRKMRFAVGKKKSDLALLLQDTVLSFYVFIASVLSCLLLYVIYQISISLHAISCLVMAGKRCLLCAFHWVVLVFPTVFICDSNHSQGRNVEQVVFIVLGFTRTWDEVALCVFWDIFQPYPAKAIGWRTSAL